MKKLIIAACMMMSVAGVVHAADQFIATPTAEAKFFTVETAEGNISGFQTPDGQTAQVVQVGEQFTIGIPWLFNLGSVGSNGVHIGPEVLGTGAGVGFGPHGAGVAGQILGVGVGTGITPNGAYIAPRIDEGCKPYYNADGEGVRVCHHHGHR